MVTKTEKALIVLLNHVTNGINKNRNPYAIPAVAYAIRVLQEKHSCPVRWTEIYSKDSSVYLEEALEEEAIKATWK
jgi:hypothetical protein